MAVAAARRVCTVLQGVSAQHARCSSSLTKSSGVLEQFREKPKPVRSTAVREAEGAVLSQDMNTYEPKAVFDMATVKEAAVLADTALGFKGRKVRIFKTGKVSQSSNVAGTTHYTLEFDATTDWSNTLMGWSGAADTLDQLRNRFRFETPAQAIYFCETQGWEWEVLPDAQETFEDTYDNIYDYNFLPRRVKEGIAAGGVKAGKAQFKHSGKHKAGWANLKRTQYGLESWKPEGPYAPRK